MKLAIIGSTQCGKSTLFHLLAGEHATKQRGYLSSIAAFGFKDERLYTLAKLVNAKKITPIMLEIGDFEGFGKLYREERAAEIIQSLMPYDMLIQIVPSYPPFDMQNDFDEINLRITLSDLKFAENRIKKLKKEVAAKKSDPKELKLLEKISTHLENEMPIFTMNLQDSEKKMLAGYPFVSAKPRIILVNAEESSMSNIDTKKISSLGFPIIISSLSVEKEVMELPQDERADMFKLYGIEASSLDRLEQTVRDYLSMVTFFTAGEKETRAWPLRKGQTAFEAAGKIHSDIQRGFIRAEVIHYDDFIKAGSHNEAKRLNLMHLEGKEYVVQDGDVLNIRFSI